MCKEKDVQTKMFKRADIYMQIDKKNRKKGVNRETDIPLLLSQLFYAGIQISNTHYYH